MCDTETGEFQEDDIMPVIDELDPNDILNLFGHLGLKQNVIAKKSKAARSNVQTQAKQVLVGWIKQKDPRPTIDDLLKALEAAGNLNASEELQKKWGISNG